jgi:hypothetical protein
MMTSEEREEEFVVDMVLRHEAEQKAAGLGGDVY